MFKRKITSYDEAIKYIKDYPYPFNLREDFDLGNISDELTSNGRFIKEAYRYNHEILNYASDDIKKDEYFLARLFESSPGDISAFKYVDDSIKKNKEFVLRLIDSNDGSILEFVDPTLQDDEDIVRSACFAFRRCYEGLKYASERLKGSKDFVMDIIEQKENFKYISDELKNDYDVVLFACTCRKYSYLEIKEILNSTILDFTNDKQFRK